MPNSSGDNLLVTMRVKIVPVNTLASPTVRAINPEYVTRMSLNSIENNDQEYKKRLNVFLTRINQKS